MASMNYFLIIYLIFNSNYKLTVIFDRNTKVKKGMNCSKNGPIKMQEDMQFSIWQ